MNTACGHPVCDLPAFLGGWWSLWRVISDPDGTRMGEFDGSGSFRAVDDVLVYEEQGTLRLGDYRGNAFRSLRYHVTGPGRAEVYFDYGGFFHTLDLRSGHCRTHHPCRDDLYQGEFGVADENRWWQRWVVSGPTKNHVLHTVFTRSDRIRVEGES
ncbi:DUF6314 family protein [Actinopolyspora mortivallis]|uniref:DUF6314 domain-containing protein n=1 Tax=Actinopolyspora mortivallis TaxID=33906 RepID=A0A2T0GVD6_ACTMO|nr:DUF6314 family protein [Actinopolyspora mortivallis]PRW63057.1 hypothetical protein CEP50_12200 [Actinopolyspora mortivallis]